MASVIVWSFCLCLWGVRSQSVKLLSNRLIWDGIHSSVLSFTNCGIKNNLILQSIPRLVLFLAPCLSFPHPLLEEEQKKKMETTFKKNLLQCVSGHVVHVHMHRWSHSWNREPKIFHHLRREWKPRHLGIVPWELHKCCWGAMADAIRSDSFSVLFFFQLAFEHLSFHHPFICSISVLSLPVSRGLTFGYCCQTPDWMECLQCQQKCARWVFWGVGGDPHY